MNKLTDKQRFELKVSLEQEEMVRKKLAIERARNAEKIQVSYRAGTRLSAVGV